MESTVGGHRCLRDPARPEGPGPSRPPAPGTQPPSATAPGNHRRRLRLPACPARPAAPLSMSPAPRCPAARPPQPPPGARSPPLPCARAHRRRPAARRGRHAPVSSSSREVECRGAGVGFSLLISRRARLSTLKFRNARASRPPIAAAAAAGGACRACATGGACAEGCPRGEGLRRRATGKKTQTNQQQKTPKKNPNRPKKPQPTNRKTQKNRLPFFFHSAPAVFSPQPRTPARPAPPARRGSVGWRFGPAVAALNAWVTGAGGERPPAPAGAGAGRVPPRERPQGWPSVSLPAPPIRHVVAVAAWLIGGVTLRWESVGRP